MVITRSSLADAVLHHPADCLHEGRLDGAATWLRRLTNAQTSRGKIELRTGRIELASAVNHAVEAARPLCKSRDHELTVTVPFTAYYTDAMKRGEVLWEKK